MRGRQRENRCRIAPMDIPMDIRRTRALVDLDALEHNLAVLAARVPGARLMPAVKADAYGHGAAAVAGACERFGVELMAVATLGEFLSLRAHHITTPVLILQELFPEEVDIALREGARLTVGSRDYAQSLSAAAMRLGTTAMIHINVDTGMGRMGLYARDPAEEIMRIAALGSTTVEGICTHFPGSDERDKEFTRGQIRQFREIAEVLLRRGVAVRYRHVANSGALIDLPDESAFDLARPGIAMYGMFPSTEVDHSVPLKPVMQVESAVVKLTRYDREWTIGYGRTFTAAPGSTIAIVPVGYGDGYPRSLSNRGHVLCHGRRVALAGRVSMDMIAVDVTGIAPRVHIGDPVILMGEARDDQGAVEQITAEELATLAGTIPYEITCGFTARVPRVYLRGGAAVAVQSVRPGYTPIHV